MKKEKIIVNITDAPKKGIVTKYLNLKAEYDELGNKIDSMKKDFMEWVDENNADTVVISDTYKLTKVQSMTAETFKLKDFMADNADFLNANPEVMELIKKYITPPAEKAPYIKISGGKK